MIKNSLKWNVMLYGSETWTSGVERMETMEAFESGRGENHMGGTSNK